MKVTLWVHMTDCGDGSAYPNFFNTAPEAEEYGDKDFELCGQRLCDDIFSVTLELDENGVLLNPTKLSDLDD